MAQYYHPRRSAPLPASETVYPHITPLDTSPNRENAIDSSSVLVFPNPPSERDPSRDGSRYDFTGSTPSLPTDASIGSSLSPSRSRSGSAGHVLVDAFENGWKEMSPTLSRPRNDHMVEEEWEIPWSETRSNRWDVLVHESQTRRRDHLGRTHPSPTVSSLSRTTSSPAPQPPFRLPFLSCLQTLFVLDESTLHIIARSPSPHASTLFPSFPGPSSASQDDEEEDQPHGAHKLLLDNPDKQRNVTVIKDAMDSSVIPADSIPFFITTRLSLQNFVEFVIKSSLRAWREALVFHAQGDQRLVGV